MLQQLRSGFDTHRETLGATEALTTVKHGLRDWVESQLMAAPQSVDTRAFAEALHVALRDGQFLCLDLAGDCSTNRSATSTTCGSIMRASSSAS